MQVGIAALWLLSYCFPRVGIHSKEKLQIFMENQTECLPQGLLSDQICAAQTEHTMLGLEHFMFWG